MRQRYERFDAARRAGGRRAGRGRARVPLRRRVPAAAARAARSAGGAARARRPRGARPSPDGVAIVGARRATGYGLDVSRALGRGLSRAGVPVVSGLALGLDAAAHQGALEGRGPPGRGPGGGARGRLPVAQPRAARGGRGARRGRVGAPARRLGVPLVLRGAQPDRRRARAGRRDRRGHGALRLADDRRLRRRPRLHRRGRARPRDQPHRRRHERADPVRRRARARQRRRARPARRGDRRAAPDARAPRAAAARARAPALLAAVEEGRGALGELASGAEEARAVLAGLGELEFRGLVRRTFGGRYEPAAR